MRTALRMALIAVVIGTSTAVAATGRVTLSLVISGTLVWSAVPLIQLLTGLLLVRGSRIRTRAALDGYFRTHTAWSLWMCGCAATLLLAPRPGGIILYVAASSGIPAVWTIRMLLRLCRNELGFTPADARRRVAAHQLVTAAVGLAFVTYASAFVSRVVGRIPS